MITTTIKPTSQHVHLDVEVPQEFIGHDVTVAMFVEQTDEQNKNAPVTMAQFKGLLSAEEADELQAYVRKSRAEWDRNF